MSIPRFSSISVTHSIHDFTGKCNGPVLPSDMFPRRFAAPEAGALQRAQPRGAASFPHAQLKRRCHKTYSAALSICRGVDATPLRMLTQSTDWRPPRKPARQGGKPAKKGAYPVASDRILQAQPTQQARISARSFSSAEILAFAGFISGLRSADATPLRLHTYRIVSVLRQSPHLKRGCLIAPSAATVPGGGRDGTSAPAVYSIVRMSAKPVTSNTSPTISLTFVTFMPPLPAMVLWACSSTRRPAEEM